MQKFLFISLFLICLPVSFALHCPDCGARNHAKFRYCYNCGESLNSVKEWQETTKQEQATPSYRFSDAELEKVNQAKTNSSETKTFIFKGDGADTNSQDMINALGEGDPMKRLEVIRSMLQGGGAQNLMQFQNKPIGSQDFSQLQSNPQVQQLMQQMKSPQFQQNLMNTLKQLQPANSSQQNQYPQQLNQIQGLFQMLNTQGSSTNSLKGLGGLKGLQNLGAGSNLQDLINF